MCFTQKSWGPTSSFESTVGLYDYGARFYDPALGRFLTPDPLISDPGDPQRLNRYSYVRNMPVNRLDPTGEDDEDFSRLAAFGEGYAYGVGARALIAGFFAVCRSPACFTRAASVAGGSLAGYEIGSRGQLTGDFLDSTSRLLAGEGTRDDFVDFGSTVAGVPKAQTLLRTLFRRAPAVVGRAGVAQTLAVRGREFTIGRWIDAATGKAP